MLHVVSLHSAAPKPAERDGTRATTDERTTTTTKKIEKKECNAENRAHSSNFTAAAAAVEIHDLCVRTKQTLNYMQRE